MKLLDDLFTIRDLIDEENGFTATIKLNPSHIIYKGHFPGHPITPGVIQLQIIQELVAYNLKEKLNLFKITKCKFLHVINPIQNSVIEIKVGIDKESKSVIVRSIGMAQGITYFKIDTILSTSNEAV